MTAVEPQPRGLAFVDIETTGLDYDTSEVWEVGLVVRDHPDWIRDGEYQWFLNVTHLHTADPKALEVGRFHDRYKAGAVTPRYEFAAAFARLTEGCVWVGCNPMFDLRFLEPIIKQAGHVCGWHYRPICAESLAAGAITERAWSHGGGRVPVPWSNHRDLAPRLDIAPDPDEHTALADARYAAQLYDAVMMPSLPVLPRLP